MLVVTESSLMRGLDYQTNEPDGIALLLAEPFASPRALKQALGRVGRFDEPCKRYMLESVG